MSIPKHLTILGGGPAGLSAGYYAAKAKLPFTIFEAGGRVGGNAITFEKDGYRFDSGAHRWHDKDDEATRVIKELLGDELRSVHCPSFIYTGKKFADFPLSPLNLAGSLGLPVFARGILDLIAARLASSNGRGDFESYALHAYGRTIADRFLLGYSEKLWGLPCRQLSPAIAGSRLKGLTLKTFLTETFLGHRKKTEHLDGSYFYPRTGIGAISEALATACGAANVRTKSRITALRHDGKTITAVGINGTEDVPVGHVISTLPLDRVVQMLDPAPPAEVLATAAKLRYRNLVLVTLMLDRPAVMHASTLYFPGRELPFTRAYEPRNRSPDMAPPGKTSLALEVPCQPGDAIWQMEPEKVSALVIEKLVGTGLITARDVTGHAAYKIPMAYPVLETGYEELIGGLVSYLSRFRNLTVCGRNARFVYVSLHDMLAAGRQVIAELATR